MRLGWVLDSLLSPRISDLLDLWLDEHGGRIPSAEANSIAVRNLKTFLNGTRVRAFDNLCRDELVDQCRERGWKDSYINRNLMVLRASLNYARRKQRIALAPFVEAVEESPSIEKQIFTSDQFAEFLERARPIEHLFRFTMIAANTCARPSAVLDLKPDQVDVESGVIRLNPSGRRQTKKYRPTLPMSGIIRPWLEQWRSIPIVNVDGRQLSTIRKYFGKAARDMGLSVTPSCIRHTMCTELARAGVPKEQRDRYMGHRAPDNSRIGERYVHLDPNYLRLATQAIEAYFHQLPTEVWRWLLAA